VRNLRSVGGIRMEQRSKEWFNARMGRFTSSEIYLLLKKGRGNAYWSEAALEYIKNKFAERMTGESTQISSKAMDWGVLLEPEAIKIYEQITGNRVTPVGFIPVGDKDNQFHNWSGGSPDGVVNKDLIIEIKCPYNSSNHIESLIEDGIPSKYYDKYYTQVQWNMFVTDTKFCDWVSYDPRVQDPKYRIYIKRIKRDSELISEILDRLHSAVELVPDYVTLAEAIVIRDETGWELDIDDYSWVICDYEFDNIPRTMFNTYVDRNEV
jgi:putative phage-type endonuclease